MQRRVLEGLVAEFQLAGLPGAAIWRDQLVMGPAIVLDGAGDDERIFHPCMPARPEEDVISQAIKKRVAGAFQSHG